MSTPLSTNAPSFDINFISLNPEPIEDDVATGKYWVVYALDDSDVYCQKHDSAVDLAVAVRSVLEMFRGRTIYLYCFYGDRLYITKGKERCLIVPYHSPSAYPLFGHEGISNEIDESGVVDNIDFTAIDATYKDLTDVEKDTAVLEPDDDMLVELEEPPDDI